MERDTRARRRMTPSSSSGSPPRAASALETRASTSGMPWRELAGHCASGALAGCAVEGAFYPLDTLKTRMQAARAVNARIDLRGLYRGLFGNLMGAAPASAVFFAAYEPAKRALRARRGGEEDARDHLLAGAIAGLASSVIRVPTEVIKTRRQVGVSAGASVRSILATSGAAGLFVGYWSFLLRDLPFDAMEFAGYEGLKNAWSDFTGKESLHGVEAAALGAFAGAATGAATTPLDVVKTRLMTSPDAYRGVVHCFTRTVAEEGISALFKGVQPRVLWIGLGGGCFFAVLETARGVFLPAPDRANVHDAPPPRESDD